MMPTNFKPYDSLSESLFASCVPLFEAAGYLRKDHSAGSSSGLAEEDSAIDLPLSTAR